MEILEYQLESQSSNLEKQIEYKMQWEKIYIYISYWNSSTLLYNTSIRVKYK